MNQARRQITISGNGNAQHSTLPFKTTLLLIHAFTQHRPGLMTALRETSPCRGNMNFQSGCATAMSDDLQPNVMSCHSGNSTQTRGSGSAASCMRCCNPSNVLLCYCTESSVPSIIRSILVSHCVSIQARSKQRWNSETVAARSKDSRQSCLVEMCMIGCMPDTQQHPGATGILSTPGLSID